MFKDINKTTTTTIIAILIVILSFGHFYLSGLGVNKGTEATQTYLD